jgi:hypothetical protein
MLRNREFEIVAAGPRLVGLGWSVAKLILGMLALIKARSTARILGHEVIS